MKNKKILITGGAGFIGSNLASTLQKKFPDNEYFIIDNFSSGNYKNILDFKGDIISENIEKIDLNSCFSKGIDIIFHEAAITDTTVLDQRKMMETNVKGFRNILNLALKNKSDLIYASSAAVYGHSADSMKVGKNEKPANIYGFSKLVVDNIAQKYFNDIKIIGLRYFNVYGCREKYKDKMSSMIWKLYLQMKKGNRPKIFKFGEQRRDHVYIKDIIRANLLAIEAKKSGIFNIGTGEAVTFNKIIQNLNEILDTNFKPEYIENPYQNCYQDFTQADLTRTRKILNYHPKYDIKKGIQEYFNMDKKRT